MSLAELGIYPAVDPLDSTSRIMDPNIVGEEHYNVARGVQKILQVVRGVMVGGVMVGGSESGVVCESSGDDGVRVSSDQ